MKNTVPQFRNLFHLYFHYPSLKTFLELIPEILHDSLHYLHTTFSSVPVDVNPSIYDLVREEKDEDDDINGGAQVEERKDEGRRVLIGRRTGSANRKKYGER